MANLAYFKKIDALIEGNLLFSFNFHILVHIFSSRTIVNKSVCLFHRTKFHKFAASDPIPPSLFFFKLNGCLTILLSKKI